MSPPSTATPATAAGAPLVSPAARRYALGLLFCAYTINYVDRQVVTILQDPIKAELGLSDTQLGLVTGLSFALFYAVLSVPIARLADRHSRKLIIVVSMALWSVMTTLCAAATSFATLLLYRVGVGVGEAGLTPPAHSLISDYYEPHRRAGALAIYSSAGSIGLMAGFLAGGWINQLYGWRTAVLAVGGPGIVLALIAWLTMVEPRRGQFDAAPSPAGDAAAGYRGALGTLLRNRAFVCLVLGCACHTFVTYGHGNWTPPFFGRVHHMSSGEIGTWLAILSAGPALVGMVSAGYLADRLVRHRPNARVEVAIASMVLIVPFDVGALTAADTSLSLAFFAGAFFLGGAYLAPCVATAHAMVPPDLRATASAVLMLGINLIGLGMGPVVVGLLSDRWSAGAGAAGLSHAMLAIVPAEAIAVILLVRVCRLRRA